MSEPIQSCIKSCTVQDELRHVRALLQLEQKEEQAQFKLKNASASIKERRRRGLTWYPVTITQEDIGFGGKVVLELERPAHRQDLHLFQVGANAALFSNAPGYSGPDRPVLSEASAYPADPDSEYGWEKLFSERLYASYARNYGIDVRVARLHNVFGPEGAYIGGKEKAPAALCRKVIQSDVVEVWGPGTQTRSFMYIDDCIEGIHRLMASTYTEPINIGSSRMIAINDLVQLISQVNSRPITIKNIDGPRGVMGRTGDNTLIKQVLAWAPPDSLDRGLAETYKWIEQQLNAQA